MKTLAKYFPLSDAEKELLWSQYDKKIADVKEDVAILREWLKKQPHIPEVEDDLFLENLLIRNKCRIEKTKIKIDNYYTSKNVYADYFKTLDPCTEAMITTNKYHHSCYMPKLSPKNERILCLMLTLPSENNFDHTNYSRYCTILFETQLQFDTVDSTVVLVDASQLTTSLTLKYDVGTLTKVFKTFYNSFSGRFSAIHFYNTSQGIYFLVNLLKQMIPPKLQDRLFLHKNVEELMKYIPPDYLPSEIGGTSGISMLELSKKTAESIREERAFILKRNELATNEKLRIGKPYIQVDLYGAEGTFKKINLD